MTSTSVSSVSVSVMVLGKKICMQCMSMKHKIRLKLVAEALQVKPCITSTIYNTYIIPTTNSPIRAQGAEARP